ncbi:MAG: hypothetical protein UZ19_OD1000511 [Parcubacteria bacterium OLB19]|nr:MAG: hypothetical protein UZ19_OD1000511 [Parcubacteria bacterium OLB19]
MKINNHNQGFSLIEMIVALGIFSIVVTTAVGSLIVVISNNQKLQAEQSAMTNLAFALDSMTREIRMGYAYVCAGVNNKSGTTGRMFDDDRTEHGEMDDTQTRDCGADDNASDKTYRGISFVEGGESLSDGASNNRILYYYDGSGDVGKIMRRVGNGKAESVISSGIKIKSARFYVTGSDTLKKNGTNIEQPTVTIQIEAESASNVTGKTYYLQTTVAQRTLDI